MSDTTKGRIPFTVLAPQMILGLDNEDALKWDAVNNYLVQRGFLDPAVLLSQTLVTSAQLLALFTTAIAVAPAPGAGFYNELISATLIFNPVTTPYTINGSTNLTINYVDKSGTLTSGTQATTGLIDQSAKTVAKLIPVGLGAGAATLFENQPLVLKLATANPTVGDGTLLVQCAFRVLPTTLLPPSV